MQDRRHAGAVPPPVQDAAARSDVMVREAERVLRSLELPLCPPVVRELADVARAGPGSAGLMASIMGGVDALPDELIRLVNSLTCRPEQKARTVFEAVTALGVRGAASLAAGLMLERAFAPLDARVRRDFLRAAALQGTVVAYIARETGAADLHEGYAYGLFRDCGVLVLLLNVPGYGDAFDIAPGDPSPDRVERERSRYGVDHAAAGAVLARDWGLPESVWGPVGVHHGPGVRAGVVTDDAAPAIRLVAAGMLADCMVPAQRGQVLPTSLERDYALRVLGLAEATVESLRADVALLLGFS